MVTITPYAKQRKRHRCIEQTFRFCGRRQGWDDLIYYNNTREGSTYGPHKMVNTKIRLTIFFAAKDGEALYSQQK